MKGNVLTFTQRNCSFSWFCINFFVKPALLANAPIRSSCNWRFAQSSFPALSCPPPAWLLQQLPLPLPHVPPVRPGRVAMGCWGVRKLQLQQHEPRDPPHILPPEAPPLRITAPVLTTWAEKHRVPCHQGDEEVFSPAGPGDLFISWMT